MSEDCGRTFEGGRRGGRIDGVPAKLYTASPGPMRAYPSSSTPSASTRNETLPM